MGRVYYMIVYRLIFNDDQFEKFLFYLYSIYVIFVSFRNLILIFRENKCFDREYNFYFRVFISFFILNEDNFIVIIVVLKIIYFNWDFIFFYDN